MRMKRFHSSRLVGGSDLKPSVTSSGQVIDLNGTIIPPYDTIYHFDQLIDHDNPSLGTFTQRNNFLNTFATGGPIILYTNGEGNSEPTAVDDITNVTMHGMLAQRLNGAIISIEHRFFGLSNPYPTLTANNLAVNTIAQSIQDMANFALSAKLAMPGGETDAIRPNNKPWIFVGGSYSGALATYILNKEPNIFWAAYSSSGVVQPIADFWQYFEPIRQHMPQNCSADVEQVIKYVDSVAASGNRSAIAKLEDTFGLGSVESVEEFLEWMRAPMEEWQNLAVSTNRLSLFYDFCDALEVQNGRIAPANGWGLDIARQAWAKYYLTSNFLNDISNAGAEGDASQDSTAEHDDLAWQWITCNEVGFFQVGPPLDSNVPAIAPQQLMLSDYDIGCQDTFPGAFESNTIADRVAITSKTYGGWNVSSNRLFVVTGSRDPWLYATFSAPSQNISSTDVRPINMGDGFHCSDLSVREGEFSQSIFNIQQKAITTFSAWVGNFTPQEVSATVAPIVPSTTTSAFPRTSSSAVNPGKAKSVGASIRPFTWEYVVFVGLAMFL
ncbi:hypothetical protein D9613_012558 [Agrocybe pediades]|uniref:Peptidase S28 n=1 Tax=Agrocybe pediades TaxID=84607 RepID=A0A8H4QR50_9AGAR|nr:hypothetical protein D9613_012558 [Agrocybe pediades]